jgi:sterol 3beta-glucosyltransferase
MHITFITAGSQGDVQPMLALAVGLRSVGIEVRFYAHSHFESFVKEADIPFFSLSCNSPQDVQRDEHSRKRKSRIATLLHVLRRPNEQGREELNRLWEACQGTDAVVFPPLAATVYHVVERLGLPCCVTWLHPQYPTRFLPSPIGLPPLPLGKAYNLLTHAFMQALFWLPCRSWVNRWRTEVLGLRPVSLWGPLRLMRTRRVPMLFGFTPQLVPRPKDWPEWMHITGYWFLPRRQNWMPPKDLVEFIEAGSLPLAIGFGSVIDPAADELLRNILEALSITGQRAVLVSGWNRYEGSLPKNVFLVDSVPYDWLFPRVRAAIHAAGAGTVAEALRAGIPSVCIPFAGEQKFYARRLAELGVAPAPIHRQQVDPRRLIQAIKTVTTSAAMGERAKEFGSRIQREDGIAEAIRLLQHYLQRGARGSHIRDELNVSAAENSACHP